MRAVVGVTDNKWASFLRERPTLTEANFWLPSAARFKALTTGEPFLFKTHWPENLLVGGGFFSGYAELSIAEAWEHFQQGNGVADEASLVRAISSYRKQPVDSSARIGCVLLRDIFFAHPGGELPGPSDFAKNIVKYKGYDLDAPGAQVDLMFSALLDNSQIRLADDYTGLPSMVSGPVYGRERLTKVRAGQQAFKGLVLASYERQCAITGNHIAPTLQAAHIRPISNQGQNLVSNGLLLRSDVHTLFDLGYLGVDPKHRLMVSPRLRSEWGNGQEFYDRAGHQIRLPRNRSDRPDREAIEWHLDEVFKSA